MMVGANSHSVRQSVTCPNGPPLRMTQQILTNVLHFSAAIVEDRMLDRAGMLKLQNLPSIDILRGELCSILQMSAQKTLRLLQANQQNLSTNLSQYVKDQQEKSPEQ